MSHAHHPVAAPAKELVDISRRSDRENLLILVLLAIGFLYLLVRVAELKPPQQRPSIPPPGTTAPLVR